ncbi:enoyl-CoA hydratase/isomerase family protein [Ornithinimicrobium ciconiae]|uniref:Enoyl-CoA hydratase/isomerase family protein n=1 Tax=Ornithinimicrobium ciconiae TaxID=2594265 RepID=A0A516G6L2_9MICO|nr:enoyl-CoA hydratase-related protein [Ornithinimicrobium ciconiae]QDO87153.1 enoyl-CoA hydratase/isomerase family protein [Ornithinimicrobium ciconiae]
MTNDQPRGVRTEVHGSVLHIILDRPEAANAFDIPAALALREALDEAQDERHRAVLLTGAGARFCAGGDVASFMAAAEGERSAYLHELATMLEAQLRRLADLAKPVVTAVQGAVAGAGLAFVLNSDIVVAARSTKFVWAYAGVGLTPDCGVSYLLPRVIGLQRALDMAIGGTMLSAQTAQEWGLVARVADDERAQTIARDLVQTLAEGPTGAHGHAGRLLRQAFEVDRDTHAADEAATIAARVNTPEAAALIEQFSARSRTPGKGPAREA